MSINDTAAQQTIDALIESKFGEKYVGAVDTSHFARVVGDTTVRFTLGGKLLELSRASGKFYLTKV